jgi:5-methylcytosine-specific restriction endonuclease McrA
MLNQSVLVLNRSWMAVHITHARRALTLLYLGVAKAVSTDDYQTYDFESWKEASKAAHEQCIYAVNFKIRIPEVILIPGYAGIPKRELVLNRKNLFERDDYTCQYCRNKMRTEDLTIDHIVPRSRGGKNSWDNLVLACIECNKKKQNRLPEEAGMRLIRKPVRPKAMPGVGIQISAIKKISWQRFLNRAYWETELKDS